MISPHEEQFSPPEHPLQDGLHTFKSGKKRPQLYVTGGVMWMPVEMLHPIMVFTSGKPLMIVNDKHGVDHAFMRASDMIELLPKRKSTIAAIATKHGISL
jgi:hypothetical protein